MIIKKLTKNLVQYGTCDWRQAMRIIAGTETNYDFYLISPKEVGMNKILNVISENTGMRKRSFADLEVQIIFSQLFRNAVDLKHNYQKYYNEEYDSFREFLYQYKTLEYVFIDSIRLQENETLWQLRYNIDSYDVENILGHQNENLPLLNHFLEVINL